MGSRQELLAIKDGNRKGMAQVAIPDNNGKPAPAFADEAKQHQSLHSQILRQEQSGKQAGKYVSPSDGILSPASAKLNAFKEKRFAKSIKPRALFAKSTTTSHSDLLASDEV